MVPVSHASGCLGSKNSEALLCTHLNEQLKKVPVQRNNGEAVRSVECYSLYVFRTDHQVLGN